MKKKLLIGVVIFLFLAAASASDKEKKQQVANNAEPTTNSEVVGGSETKETTPTKNYKEVSGRLSSTVSFIYKDPKIKGWLEAPGRAFVEAWLYFEDDVSNSTIMGLDMEFLEGSVDPIRFEGADWMALVGVQRSGTVWVAGGLPEALEGKPSKDRAWQFKELGTSLKPNTWYKLRTEADFDKLEFISFNVSGPGLNKTIDLSGIQLDYPNKMNFTGRSLTHYVWAIDGTAIGGTKEKSSSAYFDDIRYGIYENGAEVTLYTQNNESFGTTFAELPIKLDWGKIVLENIDENVWYQEREEALTRPIAKPFARSGTKVVEVDADVRDISREEWEGE